MSNFFLRRIHGAFAVVRGWRHSGLCHLRPHEQRGHGLGIIKSAVTKSLVEHLVETGHQRMVMLVREERRKSTPGLPECFFLEWLLDHERLIHRRHSPAYRAACWRHVRSLPGTRPRLEPQAATAWFAQLLENPDTAPRACQWKAK